MDEYVVKVYAFGLDEAARNALFDRVADAAHALDEQVMCSSNEVVTATASAPATA